MTAVTTYLGFVWIYSGDRDNIDVGVNGLLGDSPITITGGYGGWEKVDRRGRKPITAYTSQPLMEVEIQLVLDRFIQGESVEQAIRNLEQLSHIETGWNHPRPVHIASGQVPDAVVSKQFYIDNIDWGETLVRPDGERTRQACTVKLVEFVDGDFLITTKKITDVKRWKSIPVKKGDTLLSIAKKYHTTVAVLKKKNKIRDPKRLPKHIMVPV